MICFFFFLFFGFSAAYFCLSAHYLLLDDEKCCITMIAFVVSVRQEVHQKDIPRLDRSIEVFVGILLDHDEFC